MMKRLRNHIAEEGLSNIRILPDRWEELSDDEVGDRDLIFASHSPSFLDMPLPAGDRAISERNF
ncbi:MAG: hypothetical protein GYA29_03535 [Methanothrix sp.]|jgi:hypothetical protein|nr:hypothetical protein [Methanothrix sp.]